MPAANAALFGRLKKGACASLIAVVKCLTAQSATQVIQASAPLVGSDIVPSLALAIRQLVK
jgi:hypothetical protein